MGNKNRNKNRARVQHQQPKGNTTVSTEEKKELTLGSPVTAVGDVELPEGVVETNGELAEFGTLEKAFAESAGDGDDLVTEIEGKVEETVQAPEAVAEPEVTPEPVVEEKVEESRIVRALSRYADAMGRDDVPDLDGIAVWQSRLMNTFDIALKAENVQDGVAAVHEILNFMRESDTNAFTVQNINRADGHIKAFRNREQAIVFRTVANLFVNVINPKLDNSAFVDFQKVADDIVPVYGDQALQVLRNAIGGAAE